MALAWRWLVLRPDGAKIALTIAGWSQDLERRFNSLIVSGSSRG